MSLLDSGRGRLAFEAHFQRTAGITCGPCTLAAAYFDSRFSRVYTTEYPQSPSGIGQLVDDMLAFGPEKVLMTANGSDHRPAYEALRAARVKVTLPTRHRIGLALGGEEQARMAAAEPAMAAAEPAMAAAEPAVAVVELAAGMPGAAQTAGAEILARLAASLEPREGPAPSEFQRELGAYLLRMDTGLDMILLMAQNISSLLIKHETTVTLILNRETRAYGLILQGLADGLSPAQIASLHPHRQLRERVEDSIPGVLPVYVRKFITENLSTIKILQGQMTVFEGEIRQRIAETCPEQVRLMTSVPAVTPRLAWRLIAEFGVNYTQRFHSSRAFCKAIGFVPAKQDPAEEAPTGRALQPGAAQADRRIRDHFLNNVRIWSNRRHPGPLYEWYRAYFCKTNYLRATTALAHKVAIGLYIVAAHGELFDELKFMRGQKPTTSQIPKEIRKEEPKCS